MGLRARRSRRCSSHALRSLNFMDIILPPRAFAEDRRRLRQLRGRLHHLGPERGLEPARDHLRRREPRRARATSRRPARRSRASSRTRCPSSAIWSRPPSSASRTSPTISCDHLKAGLIDWLTGSLPGIYIPKAFSLRRDRQVRVLACSASPGRNIRGKLVKARRRDDREGAGDRLRHRRDAGARRAGRGLGQDQGAARRT